MHVSVYPQAFGKQQQAIERAVNCAPHMPICVWSAVVSIPPSGEGGTVTWRQSPAGGVGGGVVPRRGMKGGAGTMTSAPVAAHDANPHAPKSHTKTLPLLMHLPIPDLPQLVDLLAFKRVLQELKQNKNRTQVYSFTDMLSSASATIERMEENLRVTQFDTACIAPVLSMAFKQVFRCLIPGAPKRVWSGRRQLNGRCPLRRAFSIQVCICSVGDVNCELCAKDLPSCTVKNKHALSVCLCVYVLACVCFYSNRPCLLFSFTSFRLFQFLVVCTCTDGWITLHLHMHRMESMSMQGCLLRVSFVVKDNP